MTAHQIDPALLEIIVCPADHGDLDVVEATGTGTGTEAGTEAGTELVCRTCGLAYPVRDGIPVLLVDEARTP